MPVIPTPDAITSKTSSNLVSGPNAFWCLISLGIISMLQPCAFGSKSQAFSPARISPFVCLAESFLFLSSTAYLFYSGSTPSDSIAGFVQTFYQQDQGPSHIWLYRVIVFGLNALPQALTLNGMSGVPWIKTWGFVFFFSAIWDGVMQLLASKYSITAHAPQVALCKQQKDALGMICRLHGFVAAIAHLSVCCWVFVTFWESDENLGLWLNTLVNVFVLLCIIYLIVCRILGIRFILSFSLILEKVYERPLVAFFGYMMFTSNKISNTSTFIRPFRRTSDISKEILLFLAFSWALSTLTGRSLAFLGTHSSLFRSVVAQNTSSSAVSIHEQNASNQPTAHQRNASLNIQAGPPASTSAVSTTRSPSPSHGSTPTPHPSPQEQERTPSNDSDFPLYESHSPAFMLVTLALTAIYFLVLYDSEGTYQASWTEVLQ